MHGLLAVFQAWCGMKHIQVSGGDNAPLYVLSRGALLKRTHTLFRGNDYPYLRRNSRRSLGRGKLWVEWGYFWREQQYTLCRILSSVMQWSLEENAHMNTWINQLNVFSPKTILCKKYTLHDLIFDGTIIQMKPCIPRILWYKCRFII